MTAKMLDTAIARMRLKPQSPLSLQAKVKRSINRWEGTDLEWLHALMELPEEYRWLFLLETVHGGMNAAIGFAESKSSSGTMQAHRDFAKLENFDFAILEETHHAKVRR
jgi:hypothetical protein